MAPSAIFNEHNVSVKEPRPGVSVHRKETSIAESHVPTLKGLGKSDCIVKIVSIADSESLVPVDAILDGKTSFDSVAMEQLLTDARSPSPHPSSENPLSLSGSRAAQIQKILRRPGLPRRIISESLPHKSLQSNSPHQYVNESTIRRLTSELWAVRKQAFAGGKQDGSRLLKQIRKQIVFSAICRKNSMNATISTPEIYGLRVPHKGEERNDIIVDMEYIPFHDVFHIMMEHDKAMHEWLIETAISVVDYELTQSTMMALKDALPEFEAKAKSIKKALPTSSLLSKEEMKDIMGMVDAIMQHFCKLEDLQVPVGNCHGDLTFQNMLVDPVHRELCVFDFLDSFLESPLQDIAKLLQDCRHHWFLTQIYVPDRGLARAVTTLGFFYDRICAAYYKYAFWDVLPLFEFFCLARILPYMTTSIEKDCIIHGLQRICQDLDLQFGQVETVDANNGLGTMGLDEEDKGESKLNGCSEMEHITLVQKFETTTVIVPAMAKDLADVYMNGQIKMLAVNASGLPLIVDCISNLSVTRANRIILVVSRPLILAHLRSTSAFEMLFSALPALKCSKLQFLYLDSPTPDAVATITVAIKECNVTGPIFIKDASNNFTHDVDVGNYLTYLSIVRQTDASAGSHNSNGNSNRNGNMKAHHRPDLVNATRKSYVSFSYDNIVSNIAYGSFVSSQFCCGGWSFVSASQFVAAANKLRESIKIGNSDLDHDAGATATRKTAIAEKGKEGGVRTRGVLKVQDVLWQLICDGHLFFGACVTEFEDWGSEMAWVAAGGRASGPTQTNNNPQGLGSSKSPGWAFGAKLSEVDLTGRSNADKTNSRHEGDAGTGGGLAGWVDLGGWVEWVKRGRWIIVEPGPEDAEGERRTTAERRERVLMLAST